VPLQLTFVTSAKRYVDLPDSPVEVAFVGRSNVGKSSLINALANRRQLAKVSNTPGRTQLLNMFTLPNGATVVIFRVRVRRGTGARACGLAADDRGYLLERRPLSLVFVLVDSEIGPTKLGLQMLVTGQRDVPYQIVATKLDKGKAVETGRAPSAARGHACRKGDVIWVSASKGTGIDGYGRVNTLLTSRTDIEQGHPPIQGRLDYPLRQVHHRRSKSSWPAGITACPQSCCGSWISTRRVPLRAGALVGVAVLAVVAIVLAAHTTC
jgi:GTP-binding protein